jgi:Fic family protein
LHELGIDLDLAMYLEPAPTTEELIDRLDAADLIAALGASPPRSDHERYLHWDKLRRLPAPDGLTAEQWWLRVKSARQDAMRPLPLTDTDGRPFGYTLPDLVLRHLHRVDQRAAGEVSMDEVVTSEREAGRRFIVNSLMEEAIRSSQLEGATTSRVVAKELLRSGRGPRDHSERMIVNNYRAIQFVKEMGSELTPEAVLELHRIVTDGPPVHVPPPAALLPDRLAALCAFANEGDDGEPFVHPVIRAILLHFWLAYDHPFEDGNGRTARLLFFWLMHSRGYWLAEYLPISRLIRKAQGQYERAFLETETDGGDTTYFLIHQLQTIDRAIDDLHVYLQRKIAEQHDAEARLSGFDGLNGRQVALLTHALKHPEHLYTYGGHAAGHRVTHETARSDLADLAARGLLVRRPGGRTHRYVPPAELPDRLKESGR